VNVFQNSSKIFKISWTTFGLVSDYRRGPAACWELWSFRGAGYHGPLNMPLRMVASTTACACDHYTDRSARPRVLLPGVFILSVRPSVSQSHLPVCPRKIDWTYHNLLMYKINSGRQTRYLSNYSSLMLVQHVDGKLLVSATYRCSLLRPWPMILTLDLDLDRITTNHRI